MKSIQRLAALGLALAFGAAIAQETEPGSGPAGEEAFLSDYSRLKPSPDNPFDELYLSPDASAGVARYTAVMVDQPELFIHPDSKYKGMKPDDMKVIADGLRQAITDELKSGYQVVEAPGPNVLYVRFAVGDLMLQKKKRPILAYMPTGALLYAVKNLGKEVTDKVNLTNMKVEGEVLDSQGLEQLAAMTASRGSLSTKASDQPPTWDELNGLFTLVGKRLRCLLDNARAPADEQAACGQIGLAPTESAP